MDNPATRSVLILAVVVVSLYGAYGCNEGELLPNEDDCHSYFRCNHGQLVPFQCGPGTAWSQKLLTCDHEHLVPECEGKGPKDPEDPIDPIDPSDPTDSTVIADPHDSTKFYHCTSVSCVTISCQSGSVFNPATGLCDWSSDDGSW